MRSTSFTVAASAAAVLYAVVPAAAQYNQTRNLTPDGFWHNRYHQLLSMAAYGNYEQTCPVQTFTEQEKLKNFPRSTRAPWTVIEKWNTPSGCQGFSAIVPEMNKVLMIFRGNTYLESLLSTDVVSWSAITSDLGNACPSCTVNKYAAQGYVEARQATNNFALTRQAYAGQGLVFSITGHGLGGMHALIASVDYNQQGIAWYSHNYGTPRTFNAAGASWYNQRFNGEAGERGIFANDQVVNQIPSGPNYAHSGTSFYYYGTNSTNGQPNWYICWDDQDGSDPNCQPGNRVSNNLNTTPAQDHMFYWSNVGSCGGDNTIDTGIVNDYLNNTSAMRGTSAFTDARISAQVAYASQIYSGPVYYGPQPTYPASYGSGGGSGNNGVSTTVTAFVATRTSTRTTTSYAYQTSRV